MGRRRLDYSEEIKTFRAFWRLIGWRGPQGLRQRQLASWLYNLFHQAGPGALFTFAEMMTGAGLNPKDASDCQCARSFLQGNRDVLLLFADFFWGRPEYQQYLSDGHSDDEVFHLMCNAMLQYSVYPVWSDRYDPNKLWKLMDLDAYIWLRENRGRAIAHEVGTKAIELQSIRQKFPSIADRYEIPQLPRDGVFISLPPGERVQCPVRGCGERFLDLQQWMRHCMQKHPGYCDFPETRENQRPKKGLDALFEDTSGKQ